MMCSHTFKHENMPLDDLKCSLLQCWTQETAYLYCQHHCKQIRATFHSLNSGRYASKWVPNKLPREASKEIPLIQTFPVLPLWQHDSHLHCGVMLQQHRPTASCVAVCGICETSLRHLSDIVETYVRHRCDKQSLNK